MAHQADEEPRKQPACSSAKKRQDQVLVDDFLQQPPPLGTENFPYAHLCPTCLHAVRDEAAQVDGWQKQEEQHQQGNRHEVHDLERRALLLAATVEEGNVSEEMTVCPHSPARFLACLTARHGFIPLPPRLQLAHEVLLREAFPQEDMDIQVAAVWNVGLPLGMKPNAFHLVGNIDISRRVHQHVANRLDYSHDAKWLVGQKKSLSPSPSPVGEGSGLLVLPLSRGRGVRGEAKAKAFCQSLRDDADRLAVLELLLGEGTAAEEREVVEAEEVGVGRSEADRQLVLSVHVADFIVQIVKVRHEAGHSLHALHPAEARVDGLGGKLRVEPFPVTH